MTKLEFLAELAEHLRFLTEAESDERLTFYAEMIDDHIEDGLSEEEAVAAIGSVDEITAQIIAETPISKLAKQNLKRKRRMSAGTILLLVLGSPLWLSLTIAAAAVIFSLYVSLWAIVISLWAVFGALVGCAVGGVLGGCIFLLFGSKATGLAMIAAGLVCAGLAILAFFGCKAITKGLGLLTKKVLFRSKRRMAKKEEA